MTDKTTSTQETVDRAAAMGSRVQAVVGNDWVDTDDFLPGRRFVNDYILVADGNGVEVLRYGAGMPFDRPWHAMDGVRRWKKLPEGHCKRCGCGPHVSNVLSEHSAR